MAFVKQSLESTYNAAQLKMERMARTQELANTFQFNRDYSNWGKCIEILYMEVYSKCSEDEDKEAEKLLGIMNNAINQLNVSGRQVGIITKPDNSIFKACWEASKYVQMMIEVHKYGSPNAKDPRLAALED